VRIDPRDTGVAVPRGPRSATGPEGYTDLVALQALSRSSTLLASRLLYSRTVKQLSEAYIPVCSRNEQPYVA